jgi:hypothetical protein
MRRPEAIDAQPRVAPLALRHFSLTGVSFLSIFLHVSTLQFRTGLL